MSLRDQLLAKGLVTKKKAQQADRALKSERKRKQADKKKKRVLAAEAASAESAATAERERALRQRRVEHQIAREADERTLRVRNLISGNRVQPGRGHRFWHRDAKGTHLLAMSVSTGVARELRSGAMGIAALDLGTRIDYVVVRGTAARTLWELAPAVVVFWFADTAGVSDPDNAFLPELPEPDLRARRATAADLRAGRGSSPRTGA